MITENLDLFDQPTLNSDPEACPLGYHRYPTDEEMVKIFRLRDAGLSPLVWAAHFVLREKITTAEQFCSFQPNEEWGSFYAGLLKDRQEILSKTITA